MAAWTYKNCSIIQKNRLRDGRWLSTATFRTKQGEINLTAYPRSTEGYASETKAQQATEKFVRNQIDKLRPY
jgi:hypothetical protein